MIQDSAKISLFDGTYVAASEVYPGKDVLSFNHAKRMSRARVLDRTFHYQPDVICILLSNGQKLTGSRDQKIAVYVNKTVRFRPLADISIGDHLRGERAGMPVVVSVIGLAFDVKREVRLVGLQVDKGKNFVAEGILCL